MQQAFKAAQAGHQGPNLPTLDFSLKPGETVSLKLADKVRIMIAELLKRTSQLAADQEALMQSLQTYTASILSYFLEPSCKLQHSLPWAVHRTLERLYRASICLHVQAPVPRSSFMSKRLAAMSIPEASQSGALLPPPPTTAELEPRSSSGQLHEGRSSTEGAAARSNKQHADHAPEQQRSTQKSTAAKGSDAVRDVQEQRQQHVLPSSVDPVEQEGMLDEKGDEEDEQFGSFVVA